MKTIHDINIYNYEYQYNFQEQLTEKLDALDWDFNQEIINQIILWKVNRFAWISDKTLDLLNKISKNNKQIDNELLKQILNSLLDTKWIRLPMASTILRFKNPNIFQIIDQRVYRLIYWKELQINWIKNEEIINLYIKYLTDLKEICIKYKINFSQSDRILYSLDKIANWKEKIKY